MSNQERILIADDSFVVRDSLNRLLEAYNFEVAATAASVDEVKKITDDPKINFTFAIVDGKMPREGDGQEAASYIKNRRPNVKVMSLSADLQSWGDIRMEKRGDPQEILDAIRNA